MTNVCTTFHSYPRFNLIALYRSVVDAFDQTRCPAVRKTLEILRKMSLKCSEALYFVYGAFDSSFFQKVLSVSQRINMEIGRHVPLRSRYFGSLDERISDSSGTPHTTILPKALLH